MLFALLSRRYPRKSPGRDLPRRRSAATPGKHEHDRDCGNEARQAARLGNIRNGIDRRLEVDLEGRGARAGRIDPHRIIAGGQQLVDDPGKRVARVERHIVYVIACPAATKVTRRNWYELFQSAPETIAEASNTPPFVQVAQFPGQ